MAKYHHFTFGYGDNIHTVFENLCTEKSEEANGNIRFYLDDKSIKQLEPEHGDIGANEFGPAEYRELGIGDDLAWRTDEGIDVGDCRIIYRNVKPFITPKQEN